ncbi:MAG: AMP-binding protein, partial [SAR324 cluster bacterium]|nr:AMP-binding protein [SAR324 cluster bacterium]
MSGALATALDGACREFGGAVAADEEESLALADFSTLAGEVTQTLLDAGVRPDEPVAVLVSNRVRDLAAFLAVWRAGAVVAPVHRTTPGLAMQGLLERLGARFVLDCRPHGRAVSLRAHGIEAETKGCLHRLPLPPPAHRPLLEGAALIIFTSGTTGLPKGAVLGHDAFAGKLEAIDSLLHFNPGTRTLLVLQITFSFGIWVSLLTLLRGGHLLMQEQFTADGLLPALRAHRATTVALVPTMLRAYLAKLSGPERRAELEAFAQYAPLTQLL